MSRRMTFIATVLILFLALPAVAADKRSYVSGNFFLELEGTQAGFISSVDGGFALGEVVEEASGPEYFVKKHLEDPPGYSDITIEFGTGMSPAVYLWIKDVLDGNLSKRKSGAIIALNFNNQVIRRLDFANAQITGIRFPALNAASKDAASIRLTLTPEATSVSSPGGTFKGPSQTKSAKKWSASNFRLSIKGLDTSKVSAVDAIDIVIPRTARPDAACEICNPVIPQINYPNLEIAGSEAFASTWFAWHQSFVIAGQHSDADEKTATLDYLDPTLQNVLFSLSLAGLGITSVANEPAAAGSDSVLKVHASMYSEKITLTLFPSAP
jgi:hypothetical protein